MDDIATIAKVESFPFLLDKLLEEALEINLAHMHEKTKESSFEDFLTEVGHLSIALLLFKEKCAPEHRDIIHIAEVAKITEILNHI